MIHSMSSWGFPSSDSNSHGLCFNESSEKTWLCPTIWSLNRLISFDTRSPKIHTPLLRGLHHAKSSIKIPIVHTSSWMEPTFIWLVHVRYDLIHNKFWIRTTKVGRLKTPLGYRQFEGVWDTGVYGEDGGLGGCSFIRLCFTLTVVNIGKFLIVYKSWSCHGNPMVGRC